jgi:hypothetical protein
VARHNGTIALANEDREVRGVVRDIIDPRDRIEERTEFHAALQELHELPERIQAVVLLNAVLGRHQDVGDVLGISRPRVAYLMQLAYTTVRENSPRRASEERPVAMPRAARLRELESSAPEWLTSAIGRPPTLGKSAAGVMLAWRRAALAIDDHRKLMGHEPPDDALGPVPIDPSGRRSYARAVKAIRHLESERERRHRGRALER